MTFTTTVRVDRREAGIAASLATAVFVIVGYATGLGISTSSAAGGTTFAAPAPGAPPINYVVPPGPDMAMVPVAAVAPEMMTAPVASSGGVASWTVPAPPPSTAHSGGTSPAATGTTRATSCKGVSAAEQTLLQHVFMAHLGESPSQQLADILNADQYAKSHTKLVGSLLQSVIGGVTGAEDTLLQHVYTGHLGESPSQQVADILNADRYIKTHTALTSSMLQSIVGAC